jgi:hypothetical protein
MKIAFFFLNLLLFTTINVHAQRPNVKIGMSVDEFDKAIPGLIPEEQSFNETLHETTESFGCSGDWHYEFSKSQLTRVDYWVSGGNLHIGHSDYNIEDEKSEFKRLGLVTEKHLQEYTAKYGAPHQTVIHNPVQVEVGKNNVTHDIKVYSWTFGNIQVKINFMFHGEATPSAEQHANASITQFHYGIHIEHGQVDFQKKLISPVLDSKLPFQLAMKIHDFAKKRKDLFPKGVHFDGGYSMDKEWNGLNGSWHFSFVESKLSGMSFSAHFQEQDEVNEKNFNKCLAATRKMISTYTELYGKPTELEEDTLAFKDPSSQRHWGYEVLKAEWKNNIEVRFTFQGGKGQYYFSVTVSEHD